MADDDGVGGGRGLQDRRSGYSTRRPVMAREITSCWICSVPSKMSKL